MRNKIVTSLLASSLLASAFLAVPAQVRAAGGPVTRWVAVSGVEAAGPGSSCEDPGYVGSNQEPISNAIADALEGDTVHICAGTYTYRSDGYYGWLADDVTIVGDGAGATVLDGANNYFLLAVSGNQTAISGITFKNGYDNYGGALYLFDQGTFNVADCAFIHNGADYGAAIDVDDGDVQVSRSTFSENYTTYSSNSEAASYGGAGIYVYWGSVNVTDSSFTNNVTPETSSGAAILLYVGSLSVDRSLFSGNRAGQAPAIYSYGEVGGRAWDIGEHLTVTNSTFVNNKNLTNGDSGAIGHERNWRDLTLTNNVFKKNTGAYYGGAVETWQVFGSTSITGNRFIGNRAGEGGALWIDIRGGTANIRKNRFSNNRARSGGAISFECELVSPRRVISNLTRQNYFSGNVAQTPASSADFFRSKYDTTGSYCSTPPG